MKLLTVTILTVLFVSVASLNSEERGLGDAVKTEAGMKPFAWPKRLVSLPFGKEVRYRDTAYRVLAFLKDGDAYLQVTRGEEVVSKLWLWDGGQFSILDLDSPMPMLEGWGERYDGLGTRWLILPTRGRESARYEMAYIEVYTTNKTEALALEPQVVQLRTNANKRVVYFLGHHTSTTQNQASDRFKDAQKLP